jgi:hypothetical protein
VTITEFSREKQTPPELASYGRIELGGNEIPVTPDSVDFPDYAGGIKVVILEGGY